MKHSEEWSKRQSEGVRRAWAEGKYVGKNRPDYVSIAAKNRGRKQSPEEVEKRRMAVIEAWKRGDYHTPEAIKNRKIAAEKARLTAVGMPPDHMERIRNMRNIEKMRAENSIKMKLQREQWKSNGFLQKVEDARIKKLKNSHGFGKNRRGSLEHSNVKKWKIRSSLGKVYEFINLREWARQNENLFEDYRPESRMPFAERIAAGIKNISKPRRPNAPTHYQGWTVVDSMYKKDILDRESAAIIA